MGWPHGGAVSPEATSKAAPAIRVHFPQLRAFPVLSLFLRLPRPPRQPGLPEPGDQRFVVISPRSTPVRTRVRAWAPGEVPERVHRGRVSGTSGGLLDGGLGGRRRECTNSCLLELSGPQNPTLQASILASISDCFYGPQVQGSQEAPSFNTGLT